MTLQEFQLKYDIRLTEQQRQAVSSVNGAVLVLAVPGSGKTHVLISRIGYMIFGCGISPDNILTMTYTRAATADMKNRFTEMFGEKFYNDVEFRTINGVSRRIINRYERYNRTKAFELVTDDGKISKIITDIAFKITKEFPTESEIKDIRLQITYVKNMMISENELEDYDFGIEHFSDIFKAYKKYLLDNRLMDYDDQMVYAYNILKRYPEILNEFQEQFKYICVDEAQDTSKIQHEIIRLLASKYKNIFMVGDEDQSIYGFRAAYPQALIDFPKIYSDVILLKMEENFRSTSQITNLASRLIKENQNRYEKKMFTRNSNGSEVKFIPSRSRFAQYKYLLSVAKDCKDNTAVLFRNNESAIPLIDLLEREGIPYSVKRSDGSFFTHRVVRDIVNILRFALNPKDADLFMNIYYKTNFIMSKKVAERVCAVANEKNISIPKAVIYVEEADKGRLTDSMISNLNSLPKDKPSAAIDRIVQYMGYGRYLNNNEMQFSKIDILSQLAANEKNITAFLSRIEEVATIIADGPEHINPDFILSTIHSSKGLEYNNVYIIDVVDGILPSKSDGESDVLQEEEERRLFYVAMTRAKHRLSIFDLTENEQCSFTNEAKNILNRGRKSPSHVSVTPIQGAFRQAKAGEKIRHIDFGNGVIKRVDGDIIFVEFSHGNDRALALTFSLKKGIIEFV